MEIKSKLYLQIILLINDGEKSVCLCRVLLYNACSFTVFCLKKCHKKKKRKNEKEKEKKIKRVTPGWIDIPGPGPVSFLS